MVIVQDITQCVKCWNCIEVCPREVWEVLETTKLPTPSHLERCIECEACIVNCIGEAITLPPRFWQRGITKIVEAVMRQ